MIKKFISPFLFFCFATEAQERILINDNFDTNSNKWELYSGGDFETSINKGVYELKNKSAAVPYWTFLRTNYNSSTENFTAEATIRFTKGAEDQGSGILLGLYNDNSAFVSFYISPNGYYCINHYYSSKNHFIKEWTKTELVKKKEKNKLSVKREYNCVYFFINDNEVFYSCEFNHWGNGFGFNVGTNQSITADDFFVKAESKNISLVENAISGKKKEDMGTKINSKFEELLPIVSYDGNTLYFVRTGDPENKGGKTDYDIWYSIRDEKGNWSDARNAGFPLNNAGANAVQSVAPDNNTLVVSNSYKADGSVNGPGLSYTNYQVNGWEVPKPFTILNLKNLNEYVDYFLTSDNKILLSAIDFGNSYGKKDIYVSFLKDDGTFSEPLNIGNKVNSKGEEFGIYLAADNKTLYFSSTGHACYGNADVFMSKRLDESWQSWSEPLNLGPEINSINWDGAFKISAKGDFAYISCTGDSSIEGSSDIYRILLNKETKPEPVLLIYGKVLNKKTNAPLSAAISYNDLKDNKQLGIATSNTRDGSYKIILPIGKSYSFLADKKGFYSISENINVDQLKEYTEVERNLYLAPIEVGEVIRLNNIFFELNKADLKDESTAELNRLIKLLKDDPAMMIEIGGHTDNQGSDAYNITLSLNRVNSVITYLTQNGIEKSRLSGKGYGKSKPVASNDTEDGRANNRRVEFTVLKK
jgi:OOP family OmpA-OmpF porin